MGDETIWPTRPLKDCAVWYSGGTPNKATPRYWGGSIPWISAKSLNDFFVSDSEDRVTEEGARNGTRLVPKDSILFIVRGMSLKSEFRMGIATRPVTFNQDLKALVAVDDVVPAYLAYAIRSKTTEILQMVGEAGHGTGVLPTDRIQSLEIPVPSLEEQHAVAAIVGALDAKIELNRKMNATLEAMARALFKSWFQEQSEAGVIDEKLVSDLAADGVLQVGDGYRAKNDEMASEGLPFARAGNIDNGFDFVGADLLGSPGVSKAGDKVSRACDVVFTSKGTVGRFAFVDPTMHPFVYSPQLCFWRSTNHDALNPFVLRQWMASRWFLDQVDRVKGQTDMAEYVSLRDQRAMRFPLATPESQAAIGVQLAELQRLVWNNEREAHTLAHIRDKLLPRLLSGGLLVDGAERVVEEVA
jgi:type I restriction enzyme S subunit